MADHFALRWRELTGDAVEPASPPAPAGEQTVQVVRTIAEGMYDRVPRGEFSDPRELRPRRCGSAQRLIYIENQFLWAPEIVAILADKLRNPPHPDFRVVLVLPAKPNNGRDDTLGQLGLLAEAATAARAGCSRRRCARAPAAARTRCTSTPRSRIVDDRWLTVGSANLNAHSLLNDTEMNVVCDDPELARDTRVRLWAEHLELEPTTVAAVGPVGARRRALAADRLRAARAPAARGAAPTHRLLALPGVSRRSRRLLGPLQGLIDDG